MKLFVAGLPFDMNQYEIKQMFELYGKVLSTKLVTDPNTRKSKGYGFVEFSSVAEAHETIQLLNGKKIGGKTLTVKSAEQKL